MFMVTNCGKCGAEVWTVYTRDAVTCNDCDKGAN